jgi:DNA-binding transcriptional ArsR family regulator
VRRRPRKDIGQIRWAGNCRAILIHLWASEQPEHLAARIVSDLDIPYGSVVYALHRLEAAGYVARREGGAVRQFASQFNGGSSTYGTLSNAFVWHITEEGKAKADALAAEKEG